MNKERQYLHDLLAYVRYVNNNDKLTIHQKYLQLLGTIGHDINGILNDDRCFRPRVSGYSALDLQ